MTKPHRELTEFEKLAKHADTAHAGGLLDFERTFRWAEGRIEELEGALKGELPLIRHFAECIREGNYLDQRLWILRHIERLERLASANSRED